MDRAVGPVLLEVSEAGGRTPVAPAASRVSFGRRSELVALPAALVVATLFLFPLARMIWDSLLVAGRVSGERYAALLQSEVFWRIVWRTLEISAIVSLLCLILGYPLAYALCRLRPRVAALLLLVVLIPYFTNTLIRTYAWIVVLADNGLVNELLIRLGVLEQPMRLAFSEVGALIGLVQIELPLMVLPLYSVMRGIDRSLVRAAQSLGASPALAFWHVFRPLSGPGVAAGASLVFVTMLGVFVTPALLGAPGQYFLAQSIEVRVNGLSDFGGGAAQATVLLVIVLVLGFVLRRPLGLALPGADAPATVETRVGTASARRERRLRRALHWPAALLAPPVAIVAAVATAVRRPLLAFVTVVVLSYLALPMFVVVMLAFSAGSYLGFPPPGFSLRWFGNYLGDPLWTDATWFSLFVATVSAAVATALGTLAAFPLVRSRVRGLGAAQVLFLSPLVLPQMVFALALFFVVAPLGLIGTPLPFVAAYVVLGLPYALVVMTAVLRRFDRSLEQAAASLGASATRTLFSITLPLVWPGVASAFIFAFLAAFDDLIIAIFMSAPGATTLPMLMWTDIHFNITPRIAAVGVLFLLVTVAAVALASIGRRLPFQHDHGDARRA